MPGSLRIAVKFCGNCNPHIAGGKILCDLKEKIKQDRCMELVSKEAFPEVLLVISGCPVDCAQRPPGFFQEILVAGETVNLYPCRQEEISGEIFKLLCQFREEKLA
jgi:hypothetical protein